MFPLISECGCPKGNPLAVPPVYAQKCDADGACYCESEEMDFREDGCYLGSTYMTEKLSLTSSTLLRMLQDNSINI